MLTLRTASTLPSRDVNPIDTPVAVRTAESSGIGDLD
jgi:hypothetical protein